MRKQNAKRAVPRDVVPGRRTKRCSRFRPGDSFCESGVRCLWPGSKGEKYWPLDHTWSLSSSLLDSWFVAIFVYLYSNVLIISFKRYAQICRRIFDNCSCAIEENMHGKLQIYCWSLVVFNMVRDGRGANWHARMRVCVKKELREM